MLIFDGTNQTRHVVKSERGSFKKFCKNVSSKMGSILKTVAAFLENQAFVWMKKATSQKAKQFQKIIDNDRAQISAPAK